ncbi:MAG: corrinoid protein [Deltaproteobacteria bacterium]|nr:corrinoid protein [Deltaproteobacteria bacterium]
MVDFSKMIELLMVGDAENLVTMAKKMLEDGVNAASILNDGLVTGMDIVGNKMEQGEMFIPEVLFSAQAMATAVEVLKPHLSKEDMSTSGKIVVGTVKGDLHDIGKNLVIMMLESSGFEVIDLGVDVSPEKFVAAINDKKPNMVGLSALLTTTMNMMQETIKAITESGLRDKVKIIVGGAPVTQQFAEKIGADGYASDAGGASKLAKALLK